MKQSLGQLIRRMRAERPRKEIAALAGMSVSRYADLENDRHKTISLRAFQKLLQAFPSLKWEDVAAASGSPPPPAPVGRPKKEDAAIRTIERLGTVAAGTFTEADLDPSPLLVTDYFPRGCFALRVAGHSTTGFGILDGDNVIIKRSKELVEDTIVVAVNGSGYTLKGCHGGKLWAWPKGGSLAPIPDPGNDGATVVGYVYAVLGKRGFGRAVQMDRSSKEPPPRPKLHRGK